MEAHMLINFQEKSPTQRYHLMTNVIVPRPIAWVVTEGEIAGEAVTNIAPFSYFTAISSEPAAVLISIGHRPDGSPKDTLRNLRDTKKCVICIVDADHFEPMHLSAEGLDASQSELEYLNIPTQKVLEGYPPIPTGIKAAMFGTYRQEVDLPGSKTIPVIIEIAHLYVDEAIISDTDKMKLSFDAIARMGGDYRVLGEMLLLPQ
jgi:flavin reductase (DIM6/NTAB) family NADH-FMN oxidoreductase RutF